MPGKTEWIDLKREKQELDEFLSAIAEDEAVLPEENVFTSGDVLAASFEDQPAPDEVPTAPEARGEAPAMDDEAVLLVLAGTDGVKSPEEAAEVFDQALSGNAPREQEEPAAAAPPKEAEISIPLDSIETMARFDESKESAGPAPLPEKRRPSRSDFPPKKEGGGILYWIGMTAAFLIVMILALLAGYFWVYPERGVQAIDMVQSFFLGL
jgi:hypothetical protein